MPHIEWIGVGALLVWAIGVLMGRYLWPKVQKNLSDKFGK